jgi:hypothetical protein
MKTGIRVDLVRPYATHPLFLDNLHFDDFVKQFYPSQTKILEGWTNISERIFEALFKGVSTGFGRQNVEKCFENAFWNVCSAFQNLRLVEHKFHLDFMLPKRRFWKDWQRWNATFRSTFQGREYPCGKQHLRDLPTPDWASPLTKITY